MVAANAVRSQIRTNIRVQEATEENTQRKYAKIAGFLFLAGIIANLGSNNLLSYVAGAGPLADISKRVVASEHLYRLGLCGSLMESFNTLVLAFALYVTLKPINKLLAQMAMFWRLGEAFLGCVGIIFRFVRLGVYNSTQAAAQAQSLVDVTRNAVGAVYNIGALSFSIGSLIFFYLFFKSRYIPRFLSVLGMAGSVALTIACFGTMIFPEYKATFQFGWMPMAFIEIACGLWLMFGLKIPASSNQLFARGVSIGDSGTMRRFV